MIVAPQPRLRIKCPLDTTQGTPTAPPMTHSTGVRCPFNRQRRHTAVQEASRSGRVKNGEIRQLVIIIIQPAVGGCTVHSSGSSLLTAKPSVFMHGGPVTGKLPSEPNCDLRLERREQRKARSGCSSTPYLGTTAAATPCLYRMPQLIHRTVSNCNAPQPLPPRQMYRTARPNSE